MDKPLLERTLGLPPNAANEYLYERRDEGIFGIPIAAKDSDIAHVDGRFKLLTSKDPIIPNIACVELHETANYKYQTTSPQNKGDFLNSTENAHLANAYRTQWTHATAASKRLNIKWIIPDDNDVSITVGEDTISDKPMVFRPPRQLLLESRISSLRTLHKHQGKTNFCFSARKARSHFRRKIHYIPRLEVYTLCVLGA